MARSLAVALATLLAAAPAPVAEAVVKRKPPSLFQSPLLWATVNVCDTAGSPDTIGIRGSMPGSGVRGERMFMRFQIQYFSRSEQRWHNITEGADSGWVAVGSARYRARQAGWSFRFATPTGGSTDLLRGAVTFEWRKGPVVVRHVRKRTTAGHASAAGADPAGYSAAVCEIR
ncbi:MAG TPA: hypothetical protein VGJ70_13330 [Solirubrobacteraceae bacterium]